MKARQWHAQDNRQICCVSGRWRVRPWREADWNSIYSAHKTIAILLRLAILWQSRSLTSLMAPLTSGPPYFVANLNELKSEQPTVTICSDLRVSLYVPKTQRSSKNYTFFKHKGILKCTFLEERFSKMFLPFPRGTFFHAPQRHITPVTLWMKWGGGGHIGKYHTMVQ